MGKPSNIEQFAPQLLMSLIRTRMGDVPLRQRETVAALRTSEHYPRYLAKLDAGYTSLAGHGSFNHQQMLQAVRLWDADEPGHTMHASSWWIGYLRYQLGFERPTSTAYAQIGLFGGNEPFSPTYEPFRWGSILAVRLWALRNPTHPSSPTLLDLTARYSTAMAGICALGAVPFPETTAFANPRKRRLDYTGPYVSPVGERSGQHAAHELCPMFAMAVGFEHTYHPRPSWPVEIAAMLRGRFGLTENQSLHPRLYVERAHDPDDGPARHYWRERVLTALSFLRFRGTQHFIRFPDPNPALLVLRPRRTNGNTPSYAYMCLPYATRTATLAYPYPAGRAHKAKGSHHAWIDHNHTLHATSPFSAIDPLPLPSADPVSVVTLDERGVSVSDTLPVEQEDR